MIRKFKSATRQLELGRNSDVTGVVEAILREVETRGDAAVREYSIRFDGLDRETYRLSQVEIDACVESLTPQERKDIDFAQAQVRRFAVAQRASLLDIEIETLPGVILGHKNIPIQNVGCYVPGGKYPLLASAHMSVLPRKSRAAGASSPARHPSRAKSPQRSWRPRRWREPTRSFASAVSRPSRRWPTARKPSRR